MTSQGFSNYIFKATHIPTDEKVIVRFYGSALTGKGNKYKPLNQEEEEEIVKRLSELNLAPKILFSFQDGRIESFVKGRLITKEEIKSKIGDEKIAIKLAQIHSMKNMLKEQNPLFTMNKLYTFVSDFEKKKVTKEEKSEEKNKLNSNDEILRDELISYNYREEAEWIESIFNKLESRVIFSHNDVHMKNIFVLENEDGNNTFELLFMDYEYSCYNYRWADLANHICEISLHSFDLESGECKTPPMTREERETFINNYLKEWLKLNLSEENDIDSVKNIMMEVDFGLLVVHLMRILFFIAYIDTNFGPLQSWSYTKMRLKKYLQSKEEFISNYSLVL